MSASGPVSRILYPPKRMTIIPLGATLLARSCDLPGGSGAPSRHVSAVRRDSLPIWSCSVWGLPCPEHCCSGGALLPHLFTLTTPQRDGRYVFCGTSRIPALKLEPRTLSGTLLCGVRTFLPQTGATVRSTGVWTDYRGLRLRLCKFPASGNF